MTAGPGHVMIRASAGTGKTYRLTQRYLGLLRAGADPERMIALTFTRKAAGEFFEKILDELARAAEADPEANLPLLRRLIDSMPRLQLATLDAFFARIVRAFPFELGLTGDFDLLQEHGARLERRRVLRRMFTRSQGGLLAAQEAFIEAFKRATMGVEEKRLGARLDHFIDEHHQVFLAASAEGLWGNPERIWPEGSPWLGATKDVATGLRVLREWASAAEVGDSQRERWMDFCAALEGWKPGVPLPAALKYVLGKALAVLPELRAGSGSLHFERKEQKLPPGPAVALAELALAVAAAEFGRHLAVTQGIRGLLQGYDSFYHEAVRRGGRLTFGDIQRLLEPVQLIGGEVGDAAERRLAIDYRLDGGIDHWLLDEFQDTSFGQWSILSGLIDEVVQDESGARSFFCVGDVKQAIYGWRDGDHRLFQDLLERYNGQRTAIKEERLDESWRFGPSVVAMVNAVFGDRQVLAELFPGAPSADWNREWHEHSTAVPEREGQAALLLAEDRDARWRIAWEILTEIEPAARGLSCAVLVQTNRAAAELAEDLRRRGGFEVVADADLHVVTDQPVGAALLALVQAAAHPEDEFAWKHVEMTPVAAWCRQRGWLSREEICLQVLAGLQQDGYARTLARWLEDLARNWPADDAFNRLRARQIVAAALVFDESGGRGAEEFIEFMDRYAVREPESAAAVRVMTIHKAKGLGFDVVVLPDVEGQTLLERRSGLAVQRSRARQVEWILDLPSEMFWENDPVLKAHVEAQKAAGCYESLARLYVAMTRAKRGLYLVMEPPKPESTSRNYRKLLAETLGAAAGSVAIGSRAFDGTWSTGSPDWFQRLETAAAIPEPAALAPLPDAPDAGDPRRLMPRRPSGEAGGEFALASTLSAEAGDAAEFGTRVHDLLARVEWADEGERRRWATEWVRRSDRSDREVRAQAAAGACLLAPANRAMWERPVRGGEVWRERSFELVEGGAWVSGKFDRVVLEHDGGGRVVAATVYDFKTRAARVPSDGARYAGQLEWYRKAAARLSGLAESAVRGVLVWIPL